MYVSNSNKALQAFRAARELKKRKAIKRKQIRAQNPKITDAMLERCVEAQIKEEERAQAKAQQKHRKPHKKNTHKNTNKKPQAFQTTQLRQQLEGWK